MYNTKHTKQQWIDDRLDLLLYAQQIGDSAWQEEIKSQLSKADEYTSEWAFTQKIEELWKRFDVINRKMTELYSQLKTTTDEYEIQQLTEKVWALKLQRIQLSSQLKSEVMEAPYK
ncbi:hypothetical protein [Paenibacillus sp. NPDC058071]|uniref:hypothetical protein n=1 Tax=Paenibacillus sp. NPDC058071 TaxID=3346326 RepID=UPI0036DB534A